MFTEIRGSSLSKLRLLATLRYHHNPQQTRITLGESTRLLLKLPGRDVLTGMTNPRDCLSSGAARLARLRTAFTHEYASIRMGIRHSQASTERCALTRDLLHVYQCLVR